MSVVPFQFRAKPLSADATTADVVRAYNERVAELRHDLAVLQPVVDQVFNVRHFGAAGDGLRDDEAAINAAITACSTAGGGIVFFPAGTYLVGDTIALPSKVMLVGASREATVIKLKNNTNLTVIRTDNFATQTGQNKWYVDTESVRYAFGLLHLSIDGNKANQTAGAGVEFYGKSYIVHDVLIRDAFGVGFYTEGAAVVGQHDYRDLPEAVIDTLWVRDSGSHGVQYRGPHDGRLDRIVCAQNGGWGFLNEESATHSGQCEIVRIHTYSNTLGGIQLNAASTFLSFAYVDNDTTAGLQVVGTGIQLGQVVSNISPIEFTAASNTGHLALARVYMGSVNNLVGIKVVSNFTALGIVEISGGTGSGQVGLDLDANNVRVGGGHIRALTGVGAIGLRMNTSARSMCDVQLNINNCTTGFNYVTQGARNRVRLAVFANAGQTTTTGAAPAASDLFSVIRDANGTVTQLERGLFANTASVGTGGQIALIEGALTHFLEYRTDLSTIDLVAGLGSSGHAVRIGTGSGASWAARLTIGDSSVDATVDLTATGGFRQTIDGWYQDNVAASQTNVELTRATGRWVAPRAGSVTAVSVTSTEARTAGTLTVEVYKNTGLSGAAGSSVGLTAVLDGTNTSRKATTQAKDTDTFAAGDELYACITTGGAWAPTTADIRVALEVET